jgi:hypothetical protein
MTDEIQHGRPLAIDARRGVLRPPNQPSSPPNGAPVYYGFVVLDDVHVDGFTLGKITGWEAEPCETGDAFVIAPDGSRAGLVWEACDPPYFQETMPIEVDRWGVWGVGFVLPMDSHENARKNLDSIFPELKLRWAGWKSRFKPEPGQACIRS